MTFVLGGVNHQHAIALYEVIKIGIRKSETNIEIEALMLSYCLKNDIEITPGKAWDEIIDVVRQVVKPVAVLQ